MTKRYQGSCLCSQISFSVSGFSSLAANCHCSMCRKFHGAAFGTLVSVSGLQWHSGEHLLTHFTAANGTVRCFCLVCGSSLGFKSKGSEANDLEIAISCFDEDIPVVIDAQIYTHNKANWSQLLPKLPSYPQGRD
ncbi:GFA family protein [Alginatibacterium sediminis]|uniref:GFA family protein n=1 Tax=Alginatibacterium sediminis TaxID=2164068 RepID=A0A420EBM7_9ALTE|nr:GFA family protein [Alginatibacterium sediminis]RKF18042.1 GFA family protein [Alginatibacterium sediminis]